MSRKPALVVAIDGPAGVGKTAVGTELAERLGAVLVDTGQFYRALTLLALRRGVPLGDGPGLGRLAAELEVTTMPEQGHQVIRVESPGMEGELHSPEVDTNVSQVAEHPEVRSALLGLQRRAAGQQRAIVLGRDVGTVVFPDADLKVFLEASPQERARRRAAQVGASGTEAQVAEQLAARDVRDSSRPIAPLARAADAVVVNTEGVPLAEVVERVEQALRARVPDLE